MGSAVKKNKSITFEKKKACINSKDSNRSQCIRKPPRNIILVKPPEVGAIITHQTSCIHVSLTTFNGFQGCNFFITSSYSKSSLVRLPLHKRKDYFQV